MKIEKHEVPPPPSPEIEYTLTLNEQEMRALLRALCEVSWADHPIAMEVHRISPIQMNYQW